MAENKFLKSLKKIFKLSDRKRKEEVDTLKQILAKLKARDEQLQKQLASKRSGNRKEAKQELRVIRAKRKKGRKLLDSMT